jgi:hypothetical protein
MFPSCGGISIQVCVYVSSDPIKKRVGWNRHVAIGLPAECSALRATVEQLTTRRQGGECETSGKPTSQ